MRTFLGSLVVVVAFSFMGLSSAVASSQPTSIVAKDGDKDKDKDKDAKHRKHHRKHHHKRHHKHEEKEEKEKSESDKK